MSRAKTHPFAPWPMARAVSPISQLAEAGCDAHETAEDSFDRFCTVRSGVSRRRMQPERLLRFFHQGRQIVFVVDGEASLLQHRLGRALDQFLRRSDSEGRVRLSGA